MKNTEIVLVSMTNEQRTQGGIWVIGNNPYNLNPKYPGRNNGFLLVKSWVATPEKYGDGAYSPKDRLHENKWEYVRVLTGCLECNVHSEEGVKSFSLHHPDDGIEISPEVRRGWRLPKWCKKATGVTICRTLSHYPVRGGCGDTYDFAL